MLKAIKNYEKKENTEAAENIKNTVGEAVDRLRNGDYDIGAFINYLSTDTVSLFDYLPENTIVFYDEPRKIKAHADTIYEEFAESMKSRLQSGYILPKQMELIFNIDDVYRFSSKFREVLFCAVAQNISDFKIKGISNFSVKASAAFNNQYEMFYDEIKFLKNGGYRVIIFGGGESRCERSGKGA